MPKLTGNYSENCNKVWKIVNDYIMIIKDDNL